MTSHKLQEECVEAEVTAHWVSGERTSDEVPASNLLQEERVKKQLSLGAVWEEACLVDSFSLPCHSLPQSRWCRNQYIDLPLVCPLYWNDLNTSQFRYKNSENGKKHI